MINRAECLLTDTVDPAVTREQVLWAVENAHTWLYHQEKNSHVRYEPLINALRTGDLTDAPWVPENGFTREDMALVDSRFADALDKQTLLFQQSQKSSEKARKKTPATGYSQSQMYGDALRYSLQLWRGELLVLPATAFVHIPPGAHKEYIGSEYLYLHHHSFADGTEELVLGYDSGIAGVTEKGDTYVRCTLNKKKELNIQWMDKHYPDWRAVLAMAETLDVQGENLKTMLFLRPTLPSSGKTTIDPGVQFE